MTVIDIAVRQLDCAAQRLLRVAYAMMLFKAAAKAAENFHCLLNRRFGNVNLLEAAR